MSKPCEYCGVDLPLGVDKKTRRMRSFHFTSCKKRPRTTPPLPDIEAQRDALLEALRYWLPDETMIPAGHEAQWHKSVAAIKAAEEQA